MPYIRVGSASLTLVLAMTIAARSASAQAMTAGTRPTFAEKSNRIDLALVAGPAPYDLSGTGTGFSAGLRAPWQPLAWLVVEPSLGFFSYNSQFGVRSGYLFPELSVQGQLHLGRLRPFLGGGAGAALIMGGVGETVATLHATGGARLDVSSDWGISGELRIRAVRPWTGNTVDFVFGVSRRISFSPCPSP